MKFKVLLAEGNYGNNNFKKLEFDSLMGMVWVC